MSQARVAWRTGDERPIQGVRGCRRKTRAALGLAVAAWLAAGPAIAAEGAAPPPAPEGSPPQAAASDAERERLRVLEEEVARLVAEISALEARLDAETSGGHAGSIDELKKRVEALSQEIERLRGRETPVAVERSYGGLARGASKVYQAKRGLTFGGYGSALYERFTRTRDDDTVADVPNRATLAEAFFYVGYRFDDHFVFNSSVGIENALVESGSDGKAAVEFAYIDYSARKQLGARGGLLLLPLGFLNEDHEPGSYLGSRRPEVELRIIPTTWREIGGGVYGDAGPVQWRAYVVTSLDAAGFDPATGTAGGRQQGAEAKATDLGLTARVDWWPIHDNAYGTLLLGTSAFTGETGQMDPGFPPGRFTLWEMHADYRWRGLRTRALWSRGIQSGAGEISLALDSTGATAVGERMVGWYAEAGYNVLENMKSTHQDLTAFCRYESLDTQEQVPPGMSADPANDLTLKTCGLQYEPIHGVVLKFDAQNFDQQDHRSLDQINLGLGWTF